VLAEKKRSAMIGIIGGFALMLVAYVPVLLTQSFMLLLVGAVMVLAGLVMYTYGCVAFGFLLGFFLGWIGLVILAVLPDKMKQGSMLAQPALATVGGYGGGYPAAPDGYGHTYADASPQGIPPSPYDSPSDPYGAPTERSSALAYDVADDPFFRGVPTTQAGQPDAPSTGPQTVTAEPSEFAPTATAGRPSAAEMDVAGNGSQADHGYGVEDHAGGNGYGGGNGSSGTESAGGPSFTFDQPVRDFQWDSKGNGHADPAPPVQPTTQPLGAGQPIPPVAYETPAAGHISEPATGVDMPGQDDFGQAGYGMSPEAQGASIPQFNSAPSNWPPANHWSQPQP
jgi:hypothetical protein